jgi:hypothetical protein
LGDLLVLAARSKSWVYFGRRSMSFGMPNGQSAAQMSSSSDESGGFVGAILTRSRRHCLTGRPAQDGEARISHCQTLPLRGGGTRRTFKIIRFRMAGASTPSGMSRCPELLLQSDKHAGTANCRNATYRTLHCDVWRALYSSAPRRSSTPGNKQGQGLFNTARGRVYIFRTVAICIQTLSPYNVSGARAKVGLWAWNERTVWRRNKRSETRGRETGKTKMRRDEDGGTVGRRG